MGARHLVVVDVPIAVGGDTGAVVVSESLSGLLDRVVYKKDGTNPYADGVDFALTIEPIDETLWAESNVNVSAARAVRQATCGVDGVAALFATAGKPVLDKVMLSGRVTITVTNAGTSSLGAVRTGRFIFVIADD